MEKMRMLLAGVEERHLRLEATGAAPTDPPADRPLGHRSFASAEPHGLQLIFGVLEVAAAS